jgi:iron complex transport system ATP-binding protein
MNGVRANEIGKNVASETKQRRGVIEMRGVSVWLPEGMTILAEIDWVVRPGEQWALLGPNGSGKTTLLSLAGGHRHPSQGTATILGARIGQTSMWDLRERIGHVDGNHKILDWLTIEEIVLTGLTNTVWPQPGRASEADRQRARELLDLVGCMSLRERDITTCSQGERQRVRIARALMAQPPLLLLDEPATGLDLPAREALLGAIASLSQAHPDLASVFVSHHLEDLPPTTTHALLLAEGRIVAMGPARETLTSEHVSRCFGFPIDVTHHDGRWSARAIGNWHTRREDRATAAAPGDGLLAR